MSLVDQKNKTLNSVAAEVKDFGEQFKKNLAKIIDAHKSEGGVGLAAPQIDIDQRIAVIGFTPTEQQKKKNPKIITIEQFVIVNPRIAWHSDELIVEMEGCLSVDDKAKIDVARFQKIHLEYQDENGNKKKMKARGYLARIIQHETDHLNGLTIARFKK